VVRVVVAYFETLFPQWSYCNDAQDKQWEPNLGWKLNEIVSGLKILQRIKKIL
jgi:hypothetical protein